MVWLVWNELGSIRFSRLADKPICSRNVLIGNSSPDVGFTKNKTDVLIKPIVSSIEKFVIQVQNSLK